MEDTENYYDELVKDSCTLELIRKLLVKKIEELEKRKKEQHVYFNEQLYISGSIDAYKTVLETINYEKECY